MKKLHLFILITGLIFTCKGQCPFTATLTISGSCIKNIFVHSNSPIDQAAIYKDNLLIDTLAYIIHASELLCGGDGGGSAANQLSHPTGIFVDPTRTIYVSDANNNRVQKFTSGSTTGVTVAGGNGQGNAANQLNAPGGLFVDASGNIYVADQGNNRVQKWAPGASTGITVAGGNGAGASLSQLNSPASLYVNANGDIYIADQNNNRIQKWASGATTGITVAGGNGAGAAANQFDDAAAVAVDAAGNIYVADKNNNRIQKWAPGATTGITVAGGNGAGAAANQLNSPNALFIDAAGDIYVSDYLNNRIQEWKPGATQGITVAGGNLPNYSGSSFSNPTGVTIAADSGIYVSTAGISNGVQRWYYKFDPFMTPGYDPESTGNGMYTYVVKDIYGCTVSTNSVQVTDFVIPTVLITTDSTTITPCTKAKFAATTQFGGKSPIFHWAVNGIPAGSNDSVFYINNLKNDDSVTCQMTSNESCILYPTANSNSILMIVKNDIVPIVNISESTNNFCEGTAVEFEASVINGSTDPVFQWQVDNLNVGNNSPHYSSSNLVNGNQVTCQVTYDSGCISGNSNIISMVIYPSPVVIPNQSFTYTPGQMLVLNPAVNGNIIHYSWTPDIGLSNDTILNPVANPSNTTKYKLEVVSVEGCMSSGEIIVKVYTKFSIPNAFTPNGDGKNDVFYVLGGLEGAIIKDFSVFNRWGERVFHVSDAPLGDPSFGWNGNFKGSPAPFGTYVYSITIKLADHSSQIFPGTIVLMR